MSNEYCPNCGATMEFSNQIGIDDEVTEILGVMYMLRCVKCNNIFCTNIRTTKKASDEDLERIQEGLNRVKENLNGQKKTRKEE